MQQLLVYNISRLSGDKVFLDSIHNISSMSCSLSLSHTVCIVTFVHLHIATVFNILQLRIRVWVG